MLSHKAFLSCGAAVAVLCASSQALAQSQAFNVPAQPAVSAIPEFARQARIQIIAPARDLEGVRTRAVVGDMDVRVALRRLLEGTPLRIATDTGQLITLRSANAGAVASGTGAITGTVLDPATGEYLRNATVVVVEADGERRTIAAGEGGQYRLTDVAAGAAEITVSFTGYPDQTSAVTVAAGETARLDFQLVRPVDGAINIGDVVVTGVRDGDARAIMSQRQSMNITNSLSSESFGDISEGNPGEFIKFMPGVDTDSTGDGTVRSVNLRGLPPAYTSITLNGVSLAAADANTGAESSRTFSFEQMSLSAIDSIEISKTISADVDANAPAGTINIRTKRAFDRRGRRIFAQVSGTTHSNMWDDMERTGPANGGYGNTRFLPNGTLEYSDVFLDSRLGVVASASASNMYVEQEQITLGRNYAASAASPAPMTINSIEAQMGAREIQRRSASLNLDFRATDDLTLSLATMYNQSGIWAETVSLIFNTGARTPVGVIGDPVFDITTRQEPDVTTLSVQNNLSFKDGHGTTVIPSFEYDRGNFRLEGNVFYSDSVSTYDPRGVVSSANALSPILGRGNFSAQREPGDLYGQAWNIRQISGADWSDPASFFGPNPLVLRTSTGSYAKHTATGGMLNMTYGTSVFSVPVVFKTGLKLQRTEYEYEDRSDEDRYAYIGPISLAELLEQVRSPNQYSYEDSGINITTLGGGDIYMPSTYKLLELYDAHPEYWRPTAATTATEWYNIHVANNRNYTEESNALYAMATADLTGQLKVRAGLRWERTATAALEADPLSAEDVEAAGHAVSATTGRALSIDGLEYQFLTNPKVRREAEYDYFFPSASLKYSFNDSIDLQIGYSRTIRRPEVNVLAGVWSINEEDKIITAPNPGLEPELSDNLSVRLVKYFEPVGMIAINYYQNRVKGLFQTQDLTAEEFGNTDPQYADYIFRTTTSIGGDAINIRGYELEFNHSLDYLPSPFDGLTIRGSYMINDPDIPIIRSADQLATLALSWRKGPVKLYLNTVWTDEKYRTTTPSWFDSFWDTNLSGSYELQEGWEAFFSVRNLINGSRNVITPGSLATSGELGDHSAIFIHGGMNTTIGVRARF